MRAAALIPMVLAIASPAPAAGRATVTVTVLPPMMAGRDIVPDAALPPRADCRAERRPGTRLIVRDCH